MIRKITNQKKCLRIKTYRKSILRTGGKSKSVIVDERSTEESESESVHKSINTNKEKYAIDETEHEEPLVKDNPVIDEPIYFNLFKCGNNILNKLDAMCE